MRAEYPAYPVSSAPHVALGVGIERGMRALELLDDRWDALTLRQPIPNPTLSAAWLREMAAWDLTVPLIIVVSSGDRVVAGGAFSLSRPLGRFGPVLATWLGRNGRPVLSPDLLIDPDFPDAGRILVNTLFDQVHAVLIGPSPLDGPASIFLKARAPWLHIRPEVEGWFVRLPPPKIDRQRNKAAYARRRAERLGATVSVSVAAEPQAVAGALERLFILHRERWSGRDDQSHFSCFDKERAWHRRAVAGMAALGRVRLIEVFEHDQLIASALGLIAGRGALFHTPATRTGQRLRGPGHIAMAAWVEAAMDAGAEVMDLGRGSGEPEGPKGGLGPTMRPCASFQAARSPALQQVLMSSLWLRAETGKLHKQLANKWYKRSAKKAPSDALSDMSDESHGNP